MDFDTRRMRRISRLSNLMNFIIAYDEARKGDAYREIVPRGRVASVVMGYLRAKETANARQQS